jgi:hypothetical protein
MFDRRFLAVCVFVASAAILFKNHRSTSSRARPAPTTARDAWSLETVGSTFSQYGHLAELDTNRMADAFERLDGESRALGISAGYHKKLDKLTQAERANAKVTDGIASLAISQNGLNGSGIATGRVGPVFRVREALQHFVRDWSEEGADERSNIFTPILDVFGTGERGRVLVPGAGMGRLAWEISRLGKLPMANVL